MVWGEIEAIAVDDDLGYVYYADEDTGVRKYHADPDAPDAGRELAMFGTTGYRQDREGLGIYALPGGKGYIIEWAVNFDPCLEISPGKFYSTSMGDRAMGLNIALGDLDEKERGAGNFGHFRHEDWFAGAKNTRTQLRQWGTLWIRTSQRPARHLPNTKTSPK